MGMYNNEREIKNDLKSKFKEKPSRGLEIKLQRMGIGVDWTTNYDAPAKPENFYEIKKEEMVWLSDEELSEIL